MEREKDPPIRGLTSGASETSGSCGEKRPVRRGKGVQGGGYQLQEGGGVIR